MIHLVRYIFHAHFSSFFSTPLHTFFAFKNSNESLYLTLARLPILLYSNLHLHSFSFQFHEEYHLIPHPHKHLSFLRHFLEYLSLMLLRKVSPSFSFIFVFFLEGRVALIFLISSLLCHFCFRFQRSCVPMVLRYC